MPQPALSCFQASQTLSVLQLYALPNMELIFDHSPVTEGLATLSGDPGAETLLANGSAEQTEQVEEETEGFNARPVVVEIRIECFAHGSERVQGNDTRHDLRTRLSLDLSDSSAKHLRQSMPARVLWYENCLPSHCVASGMPV